MAQAFSQAAVLAVKLSFVGIVVLAIAMGAIARWRATPAAALYAPVTQPIPFSHKHHVGDDGIDCRYCHTTVEKSSFAGMPSTEICLSCHSQLFRDSPLLAPLHASARSAVPVAWNRVHDLPDFVYFDHSIHVSKGVACRSCHGRIDQMPLTWRVASLDMQWCLQCHRNAGQHVGPQRDVFLMADARPVRPQDMVSLARQGQLQSTRRLTDCSTCHR
jgi:hypothetical protein